MKQRGRRPSVRLAGGCCSTGSSAVQRQQQLGPRRLPGARHRPPGSRSRPHNTTCGRLGGRRRLRDRQADWLRQQAANPSAVRHSRRSTHARCSLWFSRMPASQRRGARARALLSGGRRRGRRRLGRTLHRAGCSCAATHLHQAAMQGGGARGRVGAQAAPDSSLRPSRPPQRAHG